MGKKNSTSTSQVTVPPEVLARYNAVNAKAEAAASTPFQKYGTQPSDFVAQMNAQQNAGIADINATAGSYQPYMDKATAATTAGMGPAYAGIQNYMSPYIQNVADTTGAMLRQSNEQAQSGALGAAASSGAFGGDRAGVAAANLNQQNQMAYGKTMADIYNQGYTQALGASQADLARQMAGGAQMGALGAQSQALGLQGAQAKIAAGTMQQQTEQAGKDAMIKQFMQEKGYPFQVAQYLANIAMGTGAQSGTTTTATQPLGLFGNLFKRGGKVEGYAEGGGVAGPMSYSQEPIWGEGYIPGGVLPVREELMISQPPMREKKDKTDDLMKLAMMAMGAKNGGTIDARHGYATTGGVLPPDQIEEDARAASGVIPPRRPDQQPQRGIPLLTQADYGMSEPEFKSYTSRQYRNPAEAAVGANRYYEKAGEGVGDAAAARHAERIYSAIKNGGEGLAPNELALWKHYHDQGWNDDVQIAGMIGRFNVEAGEGINPNARNQIGGGYGTYGIMQARGPRFEGLAAAGGMTPEELEAMPVTHGVTSGGGGGLNISSSNGPEGLGGADMMNTGKPYAERNMIGKFFHDPLTGKLNPIAVKSVLGGLAAMARSNTISPISALLQGVGGGLEAYNAAQTQAAGLAQTNAETANAAVQLLKNSIYYDQSTGQSMIPLQGGGSQTLSDFLRNPAGPSMAGVAADNILRGIASNAVRSGLNLETATPEQLLAGATSVPPPPPPGQTPENTAPSETNAPGQPPAPGMPAPVVTAPYESQGTFAMGDAEKVFVSQAEALARSGMTQVERDALIQQTAETRAFADNGTAAAALNFRNNNELAATVARAAANNNLGPLGDWKARAEGLITQVADQFGIQYDGTSATDRQILAKLSTLGADNMTADQAAASLYLQNRSIFPNIDTDPSAAAEITAEMLTKNMSAYEKGLYMNDLYRAQNGPVRSLTGAEALFNERTGSIYQAEKANIATLLKYAGKEGSDVNPELKSMIVDFFDIANRGGFKDAADAQAALEAIFSVPAMGQNSVSSGLGRYFVQ
jgi:hypothetical protein